MTTHESIAFAPHWGDHARDAFWASRNKLLADLHAMPRWFVVSTALIGAVLAAALLA